MSDGITKWLVQLGLSEFDELFAEQQVVYDDLRDLTDTDLKDLGVPLGLKKNCSEQSRNYKPTESQQMLPRNLLPQQHPKRKKLNVARRAHGRRWRRRRLLRKT